MQGSHIWLNKDDINLRSVQGLWSCDMCINWVNLFYGIATYLFITLIIFQEMLKFITLPSRPKPGFIDLKWQTPVKFFLLFWTNLVISRTVLENIPCWLLKEFTIHSATIISQWPTVKCCLYLTWEIPTRVSLVSSIKYLPTIGVAVPILNELTHIIDMGFIRWSLYKTIWSRHSIVLCFVSKMIKSEK